jgi:dihydroflavonol-4-reductase
MDVAAGHLLVLDKGRPGRRYLLGSENRSYADILGTLARLRGRRVAVIGLPRRAASVLKRLPRIGPTGGALEQMGLHRYRSSERARAELGWSPSPVDDALLEMIHWAKRAEAAQST